MNVEILYFEGCPNHAIALEMVRRVLDREKVEAEIRSIEVPDEKVAETVRFLGSPSVRVNGVDIEPGREDDSAFFGCRTYTVAGKTVGVPPEKWLVDALRRWNGQSGDPPSAEIDSKDLLTCTSSRIRCLY